MLRKHLFISFLISLLIFQFIGYFSYLTIEKANIKKQIKFYLKNGVPEQHRIHFVFNKNEYKKLLFIKPEKEFKIGDNMYDIVKKTERSGKIYLSCINDTQESKLFKNLSKFINNNLNQSDTKNQNNTVFNLSNPNYLLNELFSLSIKFNETEKCTNFVEYLFSIKTASINLNSPPPII